MSSYSGRVPDTLTRPRTWRDAAFCATPREGADWTTDYTTPERTQARLICNTRCPVREECLTAALEEERGKTTLHRTGIRGGLTPAQRVRLDRTTKGGGS